MRPLSKVEIAITVCFSVSHLIYEIPIELFDLSRFEQVSRLLGILLVIFGSLEQNLFSIKPSDETLKQGRNRDHGVLFSLTLKIVCFSDSPSPSLLCRIEARLGSQTHPQFSEYLSYFFQFFKICHHRLKKNFLYFVR